MNVVRVVLWLFAALLFVGFAATNWTRVALAFGATEIDVKLPVLLLVTAVVAYLAGSLRQRMRRRLPPPPPVVTLTNPLPSEAQPTIVPPGCG